MLEIRMTAMAAAGVAMLLAGAGPASAGSAEAGSHDGHGEVMPAMEHASEEPATQPGAAHGQHGTEAAIAPLSPAAAAYRAANLAMHEAMDFELSDDADVDFARGMIGHHQGAIDMARIVLEHGDAPELRQLAEQIIEAQAAEIAFLQGWLAEHAD